MIAFVYGVSAAMILPFVSVYTLDMQDIIYYRPIAAVMFLIIGIANNIRIPCLSMINAAGHFKNTQNHALLEALINITVSLLLLKPLGMYGLLIGTICSFAYRTTMIIIYAQRNILGISSKKTAMRFLYVLLIIAVSNIIYKIFVGVYQLTSWIHWIQYAIIASLITGGVTIAVVMVFERNTFKACLQTVLNRNKAKG